MSGMDTERRARLSEEDRHREVIERVRAQAGLRKADAGEAMLAVLRTLESWLRSAEGPQLEAQLPGPIVRMLARHPPRRPVHPRGTGREDFVSAVAGQLHCSADEAGRAIEAVFHAIRPELSPEEVLRIAGQLSPDLSALWIGGSPETWVPFDDERPAYSWPAFLEDLQSTGLMEGYPPEEVAVAVLSGLEQRISGHEAEGLWTELPFRLRARLAPSQPPRTHLAPGEAGMRLEEQLRRRFGVLEAKAEGMVRAVFAVLREQITPGEAARVSGQLPADLREWWDHPAVAFTPRQDATDELVRELKASGVVETDRAEEALTACLCALERRLSGGTARKLWDHLPPRLHDRVRSCVPPRAHPASAAGRRQVLQWLANRLDLDLGGAETVAREAFESVRRRLPEEVTRAVSAELPADLKLAWLNRPQVAEH